MNVVGVAFNVSFLCALNVRTQMIKHYKVLSVITAISGRVAKGKHFIHVACLLPHLLRN